MTIQNHDLTLLVSAARTASVNTPDQSNPVSRGVHVIIDVTAYPGAASVVPTLQGKDPVSGKYYDLLVGSAIVATGTTVLKLYPGLAASAAVAASDILPTTWRVKLVHADGDSITYSVGAVVMG